MPSDDLILRIRALDAGTARAELEKVQRELSRVGSSAQKTGRQTKTAAGHFKLMGSTMSGIKFAAGAAGFAGLAIGIKDAVSAGVQLQEQQSQLQQALNAAGVKGTAAYNQINEAAGKLATRGGFAVPAQLQAMTQFVRLTGDATKAVQLNAAATNLARGAHLDFSTAQRIMAQSLTGNVGRLQRYVGIIQPVKTNMDALAAAHKLNIAAIDAQAKVMGKAGPGWKAQQLALAGITTQERQHAQLLDKQATAQSVLTAVQNKYSGSTAAFSRTAAGSLSNLRNTLEELAARIGVVLLPIITKIAAAFANVARTIADHWPKISAVIMSVAKPIWTVVKSVGELLVKSQLLVPVLAGLAAGFLAYKTIELYQAALGKAKLAIEAVRGAMVALGIVEGATTAETEALAATMQTALASTGIGLVVVALVLLVTHFKEVRKVGKVVIDALVSAFKAFGAFITRLFSTVVNFVKAHWQLILSILTGPIGAAVIFIATHFNQVKHVVGSVVSFIANVFKGLTSAIAWPFKEAWKIIQGIANAIVSAFRWVVGKVKDVFRFITHNPITDALGVSGKGGLLHGFGLFGAHGGTVPGGLARRYYQHGGPSYSDDVPAMLSAGEFVMRKQAVAQIGTPALQAANTSGRLGAGGSMTIEPQTVKVYIGAKQVAEAVAQYTLKQAARGASSLVGGGMATGSRTAI